MSKALCNEYQKYILQYNFLTVKESGNGEDMDFNIQSLFRIVYFHKYWTQLMRAVDDGEINRTLLNDGIVVSSIIDACLLGSASERITGTIPFL